VLLVYLHGNADMDSSRLKVLLIFRKAKSKNMSLKIIMVSLNNHKRWLFLFSNTFFHDSNKLILFNNLGSMSLMFLFSQLSIRPGRVAWSKFSSFMIQLADTKSMFTPGVHKTHTHLLKGLFGTKFTQILHHCGGS
jgi:hypothetical protein